MSPNVNMNVCMLGVVRIWLDQRGPATKRQYLDAVKTLALCPFRPVRSPTQLPRHAMQASLYDCNLGGEGRSAHLGLLFSLVKHREYSFDLQK